MRRDMFAGGNTAKGFYSFFGEILPLNRARRRVFLKGSSGSGKSSFLRKLGGVLEAAGADVEYFHCSNDDESLDGVCVRDAGISAIDATAPHSYDPELPVIVDKIYDFAVFLDESRVCPYRDEIQRMLVRKKYFLDMAYGYLAAAQAVYAANDHLHQGFQNLAVLRDVVRTTTMGFETISSSRMGSNRRMFASALTPDGCKSHAVSILSGLTVCELRGKPGMGAEWMLTEISRLANAHGYDTEEYYNPYDVGRIELLTIPQLKTGYIALSEQLDGSEKPHMSIDLAVHCVTPIEFESIIAIGDSLFAELIAKGTDALKHFRNLHNSIEEIYVAAMDFNALNAFTETAIEEIVQLYRRGE